MAKVRKRPVIVQAIQLKYRTQIFTEQGTKEGQPGDWLMQDVEGDQYMIRRSVFEKTYDVVDEETA
jgi:hypothetical protein